MLCFDIINHKKHYSYDVESLFTNIPIKKTLDYIIEQIYTHKKLKPICSKLIFKGLLLKLATECTYTFNHTFYKQIDGCTMGGPLSVTFSDIFMIKMESEIVIPNKPLFYRRFVDDIYNRRKKFQWDELFEKLNSYHPKIKLTIEVSPKKFLNTSLDLSNGIYNFKVHRKTTKQPTHWSSKIPKRYKRNMILGDLHRSLRISSDFNEEIKLISHKYDRADYPKSFVNSVIRQFQEKPNQHNIDDFDEYIIPPNFFDIPKPFILTELAFCGTHEIKSKHFLKKFHRFTKNCFDAATKWKAKQVKSLFPLKDKNIHRSCVVYEGTCSCGETYIGETKRNASARWEERNNPTKNSEPAKHLKSNINHVFNWVILCMASKNYKVRRNLEASYIALLRPTLNEQKDFEILTLFKNGVT